MKCELSVHLCCTTTHERNARRVLARVAKRMGLIPRDVGGDYDPDFSAYHERFVATCDVAAWENAVVAAIAAAQKIAEEWTIAGNVSHCLSGFSREVHVPGVVFCEWDIRPMASEEWA